MRKTLLSLWLAMAMLPSAHALTIIVDYTYDTNNFFNTAAKRNAMQAVADRFARIITSSLRAVDANYMGGSTDWRVGFTHPGTGASYQISTAANSGTDLIVSIGGSAANEYKPSFALPADTWILYAGGRSLTSAAIGGTGTGSNVTSVFDDVNGPMHRGVIANTPANSVNDLPVWGGAISFDNDGGVTWHFDPATSAPAGTTDFYSIALHEVGHALGLGTSWNQWKVSGGQYTGPLAVAAYNADNGTALSALNMVSASNRHWQDNTYDSFIFNVGSPNLIGTVGTSTRQDLLMEPVANFVNPVPTRFELTNVDVAALRDIGWTVISPLTPIQQWRLANFGSPDNTGDGADTNDFDKDGIVNLLEYAEGLNPKVPSAAGVPVPGTINVSGTNYLTLTVKRPLSATDVSYRFQVGASLPPTSDGSFYSASGDVPSNAFTTQVSRTNDGTIETIVVRDNTAITAAVRRIMRLKVSDP